MGTCLLFLCLGTLLYAQNFDNGFITLDDDLLIYNNPTVQEFSWTTIARAFTSYDPELYIPLTFVSLQFDYLLGGGNANMFHGTNLLLHSGNALLVSLFLWLLCKRKVIALLGGLVFLIHPLHTETVAWASARKDTLSTFFFLGALCAYLWGKTTKNANGKRVSIELFLLSLLAKVTTITLPVVLVLIDWYQEKRLRWQMVSSKWPYFALSILFGIIAIRGKTRLLLDVTPIQNVLLAARSAFFHFEKFVWPNDLSVLYPVSDFITLSHPEFIVSSVALVVIAGAVWLFRREVPVLSFGLGFFMITLIPGFLNLIKDEPYLGSDRYAYIPSIGLIILGLLAADALIKRSRLSPALLWNGVGAAVLIPLALLSLNQAQKWDTNQSLFSHILGLYPNAAIAHNALGNVQYEVGNMTGALVHYRRALSLRPDSSIVRTNIASVLNKRGQTENAFEQYKILLDAGRGTADVYFRLGNLFAAQERKEEAFAAYQASLQADPSIIHRAYDTLVEEGLIPADF